MLKRRDLIALLGGAATAWPLATLAQQTDRVRRIGVLMPFPEEDPEIQARLAALRQGLDKLGRVVGRDVRIDYRWGADVESTKRAATELLALVPDLILVSISPAVSILQQMTRTVPIVFVLIVEPAALGFVQSLAHPGDNITGFTGAEPALGSKWLELLKELAPNVKRVAFMLSGDNPGPMQFYHSLEAAAPKFAVEVVMARVHGPAEIEAAMTNLGREPGGGLILPPDGFTLVYRKLIVELAARYRLPAAYGSRYYSAEGGLIYYGVDVGDEIQRAAVYIDRIFRGESPGDLPVQEPTKFELVINLKTAKDLDITVPSSLLARADEVIE